MSDFKLELTLRQHTPLIHFQHDQAGATLRATEVKARLDDFLLTNTKQQISENWYIGTGMSKRNDALAYKMTILPDGQPTVWSSFIEQPVHDSAGGFERKRGKEETKTHPHPGFFGNMGKKYEDPESIKKFVFFPNGLTVTITSFQKELIAHIKMHLAEFFAKHNFGTRKTKGFGSFYPDDLQAYPLQPATWFKYRILFPLPIAGRNHESGFYKIFSGAYERDKKTISIPGFFHHLDWFYRSLRGGINRKGTNDSDEFYFKSLLFLYFRHQNPPVQWDKKTIKQTFYPTDLAAQRKKLARTDLIASEPLHFEHTNKYLVKDLLGLSSEEMWLSYSDSITKKHRKSGDKEIARFASPIIFKPIELEPGVMTVFILFNEADLQDMLDQTFDISSRAKRTKINPPLKTPEKFSLDDFFGFITNPANFRITTHVETRFHSTDEYRSLKATFDTLLRTQTPNK